MSPRPSRLCFGPYQLDLHARELRRAGVRVHLAQQTFLALALLSSKAGAVVTREELRQALWPEGTHVEFERSINFCISQLRSALRDDARAPRFVETLPRLGYRFVAEVRCADDAEVAPAGRQGSLARRLTLAAALLLLALGVSGSRLRPQNHATPVPAAQEAYLRGSLLMRRPEPGAWERAAAAFQEAVARDAHFAAAQAALAQALLAVNEAGLRSAAETMPRARAAALAALRDDPELADAWLSLGTVRLYFDWDWSAGREIERALALAPQSARAHNARAALLSARGLHAAAIEAGERAAALDPLCPVIRGDLGWYYYCARRFPEAAESWRRAVSIVGPSGPRDRLVDAFRQLGRPTDAWHEARKTMLQAGVPAAQTDALERRGVPAALDGFLAGSVRYLARRGAPPERLAALEAALGEREQAVVLLERAAEERSRGLLRSLASDPDFDVLRGDPRYSRLLRQVGLS